MILHSHACSVGTIILHKYDLLLDTLINGGEVSAGYDLPAINYDLPSHDHSLMGDHVTRRDSTIYIHRRYQNLCHLYSSMGLKLGVFRFFQ